LAWATLRTVNDNGTGRASDTGKGVPFESERSIITNRGKRSRRGERDNRRIIPRGGAVAEETVSANGQHRTTTTGFRGEQCVGEGGLVAVRNER